MVSTDKEPQVSAVTPPLPAFLTMHFPLGYCNDCEKLMIPFKVRAPLVTHKVSTIAGDGQKQSYVTFIFYVFN